MKPWIIECVAYYMAGVIIENMGDKGEIDYMTHVTLYSIFGDVAEEYRGVVYARLMEMLDADGTRITPQQVQKFELH